MNNFFTNATNKAIPADGPSIGVAGEKLKFRFNLSSINFDKLVSIFFDLSLNFSIK